LILGLPLMGLIAWPFAARAIRPLSAASRSIAERRPNDLSLIPAGELPDEFQPLVDEFNGLLSRLVLALEGERRFASHVAHELRTPLASLRLNTQLLMARSGGTGTPELDAMSASIDRAARTIEQLIALARIELTQGNGDLADTTIDFARLIQETLNELTPLAKRRGVSIHTRLEGIEHARLPQALYLVLRNLLENAIKFARPDGTVIVSGHADTEHWWLQVEDDGPGLATDGAVALDASAARTAADSRRGLGLGLKLVYRTAELIGAEVSSTTGAILGGACLKIAGAASYRTSKASINDEPRSDRTALPATPLA
jgi:two-component system sensor histidine kinase QseC